LAWKNEVINVEQRSIAYDRPDKIEHREYVVGVDAAR